MTAGTALLSWKQKLILLLIVAMALGFIYLWVMRVVRGPEVEPPSLPVGAKEEVTKSPDVREILARVAEHVVIPRYGMPRLATITNPEAAKQANPLYKDAELGDKVLLWEDALIVYSPLKDRIIALYAPTIAQEGREVLVGTIATSSNPLTVEIRNGTRIRGEAGRIREIIRNNQHFRVIRIGDAHPLDTTIIVSLLDPSMLKSLLEVTSGTIGVLPRGEASSTADVLVLLGAS
jgi:hypothetical protein